MARPRRLAGFDYCGVISCFFTLCARDRTAHFANGAVVDFVIDHLRQCADHHRVAVLAYCFMPDHLHMLVRGMTNETDLLAFVKLLKQKTGFYARRHFDIALWQPGFHDLVVRRDDALAKRIRYVLDNPVRSRLVKRLDDYPFWGSLTMTRGECIEILEGDR